MTESDRRQSAPLAKDECLAIGLDEAARRLGVHRQTLRAAIDRGDLPALHIGKRWLVSPEAIRHLLESASDRTAP